MAIWPLLKDMDRKDLFPATRSKSRTLGDHFGGIAGVKCQEKPIETANQAAASARGIKRKAAGRLLPAPLPSSTSMRMVAAASRSAKRSAA